MSLDWDTLFIFLSPVSCFVLLLAERVLLHLWKGSLGSSVYPKVLKLAIAMLLRTEDVVDRMRLVANKAVPCSNGCGA